MYNSVARWRNYNMIIKRNFWYWPASQERTLHIYLPDDYYNTDERYPVMYFFDGHNLFYDEDATYGTSWGLKDFLDSWGKKMIIVGMECSHEGNERLREYCPYNKRWRGVLVKGIGDATFQWIINDVKPAIDQNYRTYSHREATGIGGSSMGGIMAAYGIIKYNQIFSKAACVSTGWFWNLSNFRRTLSQSVINSDTKIWMSWGELEAGKAARRGNPEFDTREARSARKFAGELNERGADTQLYFQWDGHHSEADWRKQVPYFMNYLWLDQRP